MANRVILLSKDVLGKYYLPVYGNKYWKTPNIDELAAKGTVFNRHYTAAPSSAMSYYSMFTGLFAMQTNMSTYHVLSDEERFKGETLFDKAERLGYKCHIVWDAKWDTTAKLHSECYGHHTIHSLKDIRQPTGVHAITGRHIVRDDDTAQETCSKIEECIKSICESGEDVFIWMHLPHVFNGRTGYGSDIDLFDWCVGMLRKYIPDDCIFITADHGNNNGSHGKLGYGFDVYEPVACIPLITPRIEGRETVEFPTSNVDLFDLIFNREIKKREFVYCDSAYYAQLHRKLAIISGKYKLIFSFEGKRKELYDLEYDPNETQNLMFERVNDVDRHVSLSVSELYFYPEWDKLVEIREKMNKELERVWRYPSRTEYIRSVYEKYGKAIKRRINRLKHIIEVNFLHKEYKR